MMMKVKLNPWLRSATIQDDDMIIKVAVATWKPNMVLGDASKPKGRVDIVLYQKSDVESTGTVRPLMFIEVGLKGADWWKKFDRSAPCSF